MAEPVTRRPRTMDAIEAVEDPPEVILGEIEVDDAGKDRPDPEAALEALTEQLKSKDVEVAAARADAVEARRQAAESGGHVISAAHRAVAERESNIDSAIEARKTVVVNARRALKAAMEANDAEAVADAQAEIATASAESVQLQRDKSQVEFDKQRLKNTPAPNQQQQPRGPSDASRRWIESRPRFNVDKDYQDSVTAADNSFRMLYGQQDVGTQKYVDFIEKNMAAKYGDNHGSLEAMKGKSQPRDGARQRPASSTAARADAGTDGGGSSGNGAITLKHAQGTISLRRSADGKETIVGTIPSTWAEAARWCGMTPTAYAIDQIHIQDQKRRGEDVGLRMGDGEVLQ